MPQTGPIFWELYLILMGWLLMVWVYVYFSFYLVVMQDGRGRWSSSESWCW